MTDWSKAEIGACIPGIGYCQPGAAIAGGYASLWAETGCGGKKLF